MSAVVVIATPDSDLALAWEAQLPAGCIAIRFEKDSSPNFPNVAAPVVIILDAVLDSMLPQGLARFPVIYVGEPGSIPYEQSRISKRARLFFSYNDSRTKLADIVPILWEVAEKQSLIDLLGERAKRAEVARPVQRIFSPDVVDLWDFFEATIENIDVRDRLIAEFRRAARQFLRSSHAVFFLREMDGFRADRGTSFFPVEDPIVAYFENHPTVVDGMNWDGPLDPIAELAVRSRLALWGARLLVPIHDNGRLLGLVALGVREDGQPYDEVDRTRAVSFARLLRSFLGKSIQFIRLNQASVQIALGAKYLPGTLVLGPDENAPRHVPLVVRDLIGQTRRTKEIVRASPFVGQPFRASAGIIVETGGVWAVWEEASSEVHDALAREKASRRELLRELALTLSHEVGNPLVSLTTFRQSAAGSVFPPSLIDTIKKDIGQLEALNDIFVLLQNLDETEPVAVDIRELAREVGGELGIRVEVGPDPVILNASKSLLEFSLRSIVRTVAENRPDLGLSELSLKVRATGLGLETTALLSLKGKNLELEGILPQADNASTPNQGRMAVFLAKEVLRLHHGEIHAGPGVESVEILISLRNL